MADVVSVSVFVGPLNEQGDPLCDGWEIGRRRVAARAFLSERGGRPRWFALCDGRRGPPSNPKRCAIVHAAWVRLQVLSPRFSINEVL